MAHWLDAQHLAQIRPWAALGGVVLFAALEQALPFAPRREPVWRHYVTNLALGVLNVAVLALLWPGLLLGAAALAQARGWELLAFLGLPWAARLLVTVLALDALSYGLHVAYHRVPWMWRLHQVHHTDLDLDVTSASRFHAGEVLLSTILQTGVVLALGAPIEGVLLFQVLFLLQAQAQHSNLHVPTGINRWLRWLLVTPNTHRVHHSVLPRETNSNYATLLACWDWLFGTYCAGGPQRSLVMGLKAYSRADQVQLPALLAMPLKPLPPQE